MAGPISGHCQRIPRNVLDTAGHHGVGCLINRRACHDQGVQTVPLSRSKRRNSGRTNAPGPVAGARHSLLHYHRSHTGKPTSHLQRIDRSSTGRIPRRRAEQVSQAGSATHDAAHGSRNPAFDRSSPPPTPQSRGRHTGTSRARRRRRDIEARQGRQRCGQKHRDSAERAIQAAKGEECAFSQGVNGIRRLTFKA
jgi:hypothetical protein